MGNQGGQGVEVEGMLYWHGFVSINDTFIERKSILWAVFGSCAFVNRFVHPNSLPDKGGCSAKMGRYRAASSTADRRGIRHRGNLRRLRGALRGFHGTPRLPALLCLVQLVRGWDFHFRNEGARVINPEWMARPNSRCRRRSRSGT